MIFLLAFNSCQKDNVLIDQNSDTENPLFHEGMIQLGKKLDNPYSIENMRKAYQNLSGSQLKSANITESNIEATHLYVRFLPKTDEDYAILVNDTLELFDYPLDYEIEEGGTFYHDPELPDSTYTWQYCAVKKDYNFPNIEYEIIEELFLPETMEDSVMLKSTGTWSFWDELEVEALIITGNYEEQDETTLKSANGWRRKNGTQVELSQ